LTDRKEETRKIVRFALLGVTVTVLELIVFYLFNLFLSNVPAQGASYAVGAVYSYLLHRRFTFKTKSKIISAEFVRFLIVNGISLILGMAAMFVLTDVMHIMGTPLKDLASKAIAMFSTTICNYIGNRLWVFKATEEDTADKTEDTAAD